MEAIDGKLHCEGEGMWAFEKGPEDESPVVEPLAPYYTKMHHCLKEYPKAIKAESKSPLLQGTFLKLTMNSPYT
jgi:hypothetical protein